MTIKTSHLDSKVIWIAAFGLFSLFLVMYILRYHDYIPASDDISQFGATLDQSVTEWVSEGFSKYASVYPEWYTPVTELARPVINLIFYIQYRLFSRNFELYFIYFYLLQLCGALIVMYFLGVARVPTNVRWWFLVLFLTNPAFINYGLVLLSFQFDVVAAIFLLTAFLALWKREHFVAVIMLTLAVFTKEALFAPVAAALTASIWRRTYSVAIAMIIPLFLWVMQRFVVFGSLTGGNYAVPSGSWGIATGLIKGFIIWPTGIIPGARMLNLPNENPWALAFYGSMLLCNLCLWIILIYSGWVITSRLLHERNQSHDERFQLLTGFYIWTAGATAFCVMLGLSYTRYGASVYVFLLPFLAISLFTDLRFRPSRLLASVTIILLSIACVGNAVKFFTVDFPRNEDGDRLEHALYQALRSLPATIQSVYVVNAPGEIGASPDFLRAAWQIVPKVVFINQVYGCVSSVSATETETNISDETLEVRIPACASFGFSNADSRILGSVVDEKLQRKDIGIYEFRQAQIVGYWFQDPSVPMIKFGRTMIVKLQNPVWPILAYNWANGRYELLRK